MYFTVIRNTWLFGINKFYHNFWKFTPPSIQYKSSFKVHDMNALNTVSSSYKKLKSNLLVTDDTPSRAYSSRCFLLNLFLYFKTQKPYMAFCDCLFWFALGTDRTGLLFLYLYRLWLWYRCYMSKTNQVWFETHQFFTSLS